MLTPLNRTMLKKRRDSIGVSSIWVMFLLPFLVLVGVSGPPSFAPPSLESPSLGGGLEVALPPFSGIVETGERLSMLAYGGTTSGTCLLRNQLKPLEIGSVKVIELTKWSVSGDGFRCKALLGIS